MAGVSAPPEGSSAEAGRAAAGRHRSRARQALGSPRPLPRLGPGAAVAGASLTILAAVLLGFVLQVAVIGDLQHDSAQTTAYDDFRAELATATAPVGQADADGRLLAPGTSVAVLEIPALGVREVIVEGTASGTTMAGPGHRRDTVLPGQAGTSIVMGRAFAYGAPFAGLSLLEAGDSVTVTTGQGVHVYTVEGVRRAGDRLPKPLASGQGRLTLVTADAPWYAPAGVLRVDASLTTPAQPAPPRVVPVGAIPEAEKPMQGDPTAWIGIVLWGQALLLAALAVVWMRSRWGRWQAWLVGVPVLLALGLTVADRAAQLLPNLI